MRIFLVDNNIKNQLQNPKSQWSPRLNYMPFIELNLYS